LLGGPLLQLVLDVRVAVHDRRLGRRDAPRGGTLFESRFLGEVQALPVDVGPLHMGVYAGLGDAYRNEDGVSDGRIDHLVIGPSGVYAIDSEKWDKRLPVRTLSHRKIFHGPFDMKDRLDESRWEAEQASRVLTDRVGFDVPVQPSVAIYGPSIPWKVMRVRDVDVYSGNLARAYLRRRSKILTGADVERIYKVAEQTLPPQYSQLQEQETQQEEI
jgi:hypothetical protein